MSPLIAETRRTLALALPITVGQVSQMLIGITDTVMIGRVGTVPLAASAFAGTIWGMVFVVGLGLLVPVAVLVARSHGEKRPDECAHYLRHGLALAVVYAGVAAVGLTALQPVLDRFGQAPEVVAETGTYLVIIAWSLVPALAFQVLRQFAEALGRPWVPLGLMLASIALNVLLNWMLIYGRLGCPTLGLEGAGWATLLSRSAGTLALWLWLARTATPALRAAWPGRATSGAPVPVPWRAPLQGARVREMLHVGLPAAGMLLFESGAFTGAALMVGWLGAVPLAAHQIAVSCAGFTFMFPLGIAMAASMRIGHAVGENRPAAVRAIGFGAIGAGVGLMAGFAVLFAFASEFIARQFVDDAPVVALAARLLVIAAIFQIFDGGQVLAAGALRGLTDVKVPAVLTFVAYWVVALPGGYLASQVWDFGAPGVWVALAAGLAGAAVAQVWRFARLTRGR